MTPYIASPKQGTVTLLMTVYWQTERNRNGDEHPGKCMQERVISPGTREASPDGKESEAEHDERQAGPHRLIALKRRGAKEELSELRTGYWLKVTQENCLATRPDERYPERGDNKETGQGVQPRWQRIVVREQ